MSRPSTFPEKEPFSAIHVAWKGLLLFILLNLLFAAIYPMQTLGRLSAYNTLLPGRQRLPYGDNPEKANNLSLFNLEAMFASHELAGKAEKPAGEYRVIFIGDSATWGFLLQVKDTLAAQINAAEIRLPDGRKIHAYNFGYPVMSLTKDLLILSYALRYEPDLVVWPVTLESFPNDKQLFPPLLQNNPAPVLKLIERYQLEVDLTSANLVERNLFERTIIGSRRELADLSRLQILGIPWAATGIDQEIPESYIARQEDLSTELTFHGLEPDQLDPQALAFETLSAGIAMAGDVPVLLVNEPMFISQGINSDLRYNFYYPRWAYDGYRRLMVELSAQSGWQYRDYWDLVPGEEFTNSAVHMSPSGVALFAKQLLQDILEISLPVAKPDL
ncbi:MAG: hypothetical protein MUE67_02465 [Anaerolineales bacterium]|jgi:hypothetical protein|nr:hypothetical protein [Anaerolineales bacterium]